MNITVEDISATKKRLKIEVPADRVKQAQKNAAAQYQQHARIPGFRPGKAPVAVVQKKYGKEIEEETKRALIPESFQEAVKSKDLRLATQPEMEDLHYEPGLSMSFSAVVEIEPVFALPEYKGISVPKEDINVTDEEVDQSLLEIREQRADFADIDPLRPAEMNDFAVISYSGTIDGKAINEIVPKTAQLGENKNFWLWLKPDSFLPGFADQVVGMSIGEMKDFDIDIPSEFPQPEVAGKKASYHVELKELKQRNLPELTDELCQEIAKMSKDELVKNVRENLEDRKKATAESKQKETLVRQLLEKLNVDLPESLVKAETDQTVYNIVSENQARGIPREMLEEKKDEIYQNAEKSARDQVKLSMLASRIAEKEDIKVTNDEIGRQLQMMAMQQQTTVEKLLKQIQENNAMGHIRDRILLQKVLDYLLKEANVQ